MKIILNYTVYKMGTILVTADSPQSTHPPLEVNSSARYDTPNASCFILLLCQMQDGLIYCEIGGMDIDWL